MIQRVLDFQTGIFLITKIDLPTILVPLKLKICYIQINLYKFIKKLRIIFIIIS